MFPINIYDKNANEDFDRVQKIIHKSLHYIIHHICVCIYICGYIDILYEIYLGIKMHKCKSFFKRPIPI